MRSLAVLGGLAVCVLLVSASDQTEPGNNDPHEGGERGISRDLIAENEDGKSRLSDVNHPSAADQHPHLGTTEISEFSRRGKHRKSFAPDMGEVPRKSHRRKKGKKEPYRSGSYGPMARSLEIEKDKPKLTENPPHPGLHVPTSDDDPDRSGPRRAGRRKDRKRKGGRHRAEEGAEEAMTSHPHPHPPEGRKSEKRRWRSGSHSLMAIPPQGSAVGGSEEVLRDGKEAGRRRRQSNNRDSKQKPRKRSGWGSAIASLDVPHGGRKEAGRRRRQSNNRDSKQKPRKWSGWGSAIASVERPRVGGKV